ncbi:PD-(D/E)XK nuclease-like domain-containing protein [Gordonia sp. GONU]|uniref:PD-(D/E)XK nuclease-like domain-containing protein n=1 Tax=Gordonia sp. GONU TaxID=2972949 RepID=UPI0021ACA858|nr:PD-(D/E)XK nuclease-like domain-containing protein [Gordonia sp. GONU]MCR8897268.1 PD-(D/E)XK nuclease-like domain-containing protein [Gordonia sp. GONU]
MTAVPAEDGIYAGLSDELYHSDRDSLSSTGAKTILEPGGPAKLRYALRKESKAYDYGHVAHLLILGEGASLSVIDAKDWKTKAAQEARKAAYDTGKVPILKHVFRQAQDLAGAVHSHPLAGYLFSEGVAEQSIWAHDPTTGARIRCRPDWFRGTTFVDLKTTADAGHFDKSIESYSYHQSAAHYLHTAECADIDVDLFVFVAVEKDPPYLIDVCELSAKDLGTGRDLTRAAINLFAHCQRTDTWPGLPERLRVAQLPEWSRHKADRAINRATTLIEGATA